MRSHEFECGGTRRCEVLAGLDELKMHSRRRAFGKRMHYQNKPGSAYYVLTHVSRVVTYFHAEELFRLHMTPRTVRLVTVFVILECA
jgi:hypothetical protein